MAKEKRKIDAFKITVWCIVGLILAVGVTAVITALISVKSGLYANAGTNANAAPVNIVVSKNKVSTDIGCVGPTAQSFSGADTGAGAEHFSQLSSQYKKMTGFTVLRGIVEGVGAPKARYVSGYITKSTINGLSASAAPGASSTSAPATYYLYITYGDMQSVRLKDSDGNAYTVDFDAVVISVASSNVISKYNVTAYAFKQDGFNNAAMTNFLATQISVTANQSILFAACDSIFPK